MQRETLELLMGGGVTASRERVLRAPFTIEHVRLPVGADIEYSWRGQSAFLAWHDVLLSDGELSGDELAPVRRLDLRKMMAFAPQGMRLKGWCKQKQRQNAFTALYIDQDWLFDELETPAKDRALKPLIYFNDRVLSVTMEQMRNLVLSAKPARLLADSLAVLAGLELLRVQHSLKEAREPRQPGRLTPAQFDAAHSFIAANFMNDITLQEIAAVTGLSAFHFSRAFKQTSSLSPYRYVMAMRVEKAKELIRQSDMPLAVVAETVGLSFSQFSRVFAQFTGLAPSGYRKAVRG